MGGVVETPLEKVVRLSPYGQSATVSLAWSSAARASAAKSRKEHSAHLDRVLDAKGSDEHKMPDADGSEVQVESTGPGKAAVFRNRPGSDLNKYHGSITKSGKTYLVKFGGSTTKHKDPVSAVHHVAKSKPAVSSGFGG
jgi:hypothetical protein